MADSNTSGPQQEIPASPARPPVGRLISVSVLTVFLFFGGLGTWVALSPLESGAVAPGRITVASNRKTVQHLEGGIVREILVQEGARVEEGEIVLRLDDTRSRASLEVLKGREDNLKAQEARLLAERDFLDSISFPYTLSERQHDSEIGAILAGETAIFEARKKALKGSINILGQRILQLEKEIASIEAQVVSNSRQIKFLEDEKWRVEILVKKGIMGVPRLLTLEREQARLEGNRGEAEALIARARQRIGEANLSIINLKNTFTNDVVKELKEVQAALVDVGERIKAAKDVLQRTEIIAPQSGIVVALKVHTPGGVVKPGQPLLDIVPQDDLLVIEARVQLIDIDVVHEGLKVQVRLTAFKQRSTPTLNGTVTRVSADSFQDETTGFAYYLVRVVIDSDQNVEMGGIELYPGMPAEVIIITGKQTALDYIIGPIKDSFNRAFRGQ